MIGRRFEIACEKLGLNKRRSKLTTDHFARQKRSEQQLSLFLTCRKYGRPLRQDAIGHVIAGFGIDDQKRHLMLLPGPQFIETAITPDFRVVEPGSGTV